MTLPASGPISLSQVNVELGLSASALITLNDAAVRDLAEIPSGAINLSALYGKQRKFKFTISTNQTVANLRTLAVAAGWDQVLPVEATIATGVVLYSTSTGLYALTINGVWANGVKLINNGTIIGRGGNGGAGGNGGSGGTGAAGGPALLVSSASVIDNTNGIIGGGGGGAGGGGYGRITWISSSDRNYASSAGGGGGGAGAGYATGGAAGPTGSITGSSTSGNPQGGTSTAASGGGSSTTGPGAGGVGATALGTFTRVVGGSGGFGGAMGAVGATGASSYRSGGNARHEFLYGGGGGGAAGACLAGNANITWVNVGTRYGAIT